MSEIERNKQIARDFIDAISRADTAAIVAAYAPDARVHTMGNTLISGVYTVDQVASMAGQILGAFPDGLRLFIRELTAEGDRVAIEAESDGRHVSGKHYHNYYHFLMRIRAGRIVEFKEYMDTEMATEVLCGGQRRPTSLDYGSTT
jgi:hypothetical protein